MFTSYTLVTRFRSATIHRESGFVEGSCSLYFCAIESQKSAAPVDPVSGRVAVLGPIPGETIDQAESPTVSKFEFVDRSRYGVETEKS